MTTEAQRVEAERQDRLAATAFQPRRVARLTLGHPTDAPDGAWYVIAVWDRSARDYVQPESVDLFDTPTRAQLSGQQDVVGTRLIRFFVNGGFVTTRKRLS